MQYKNKDDVEESFRASTFHLVLYPEFKVIPHIQTYRETELFQYKCVSETLKAPLPLTVWLQRN